MTSFLDEECGVLNPRFRLFQTMNDSGIFLLIFDGFDEMAVRVDADTLEKNLQEIEKLATSPKSKVIITSRLEYFISGAEEKKTLNPKGELLAIRQTEYECLKIAPWGDEQINSFLKKRVQLIKEAKQPWTYYHDCIKQIEGLSDLSRRPVLLDMIVKTLPQLIESGKPINRPNLYETYLVGEIKRQKILKRRTLLLSEVSRFSLLQHLALDFYIGEISAITFMDALKHIDEVVKPPKSELEAYTRDFLTGSFLIRKGDEYQFSHRSIMEYLIAMGLNEEIEKNSPNIFSRKCLEPVVAGFLAELNPNIVTLLNWILFTRSGIKEDSKYLGGNSATILRMLDRSALSGKDLSKTTLIKANLISADLKGANLNEAIMVNVNLMGAQFFKKDMESARFQNCLFTLCYLGDLAQQKDTLYKPIADQTNGLTNIQLIQGSRLDLKGSLTFGILIVQVSDINSLESFKSKIADLSGIIGVSIYYDEYEKLQTRVPESSKTRCEILNSFMLKHSTI